MFKKLKNTFSALVNGKPGHRFLDHYERKRKTENKSAWMTGAYLLGGVALLVGGVLLGFVPGIPGFLLVIPALGLLAARFRRLAIFLDRAELFVRRAAGSFKSR
jgi:UPF0716 family protein affecting phage T7 exclusion